MINTRKQIVYTIFILLGAVMLIIDLTGINENVYLKIGGLIILMIGLYNSTKQWTKDNPKDDNEPTEDEK